MQRRRLSLPVRLIGCFALGFLVMGILQLTAGWMLVPAPAQELADAGGAEAAPPNGTATPAPAPEELAPALRKLHNVGQPAPAEEVRGKLAVEVSWQGRAMSLLGVLVILTIAFVFSTNRRRISWRLVGWGVALQLLFGLLILRTPVGAEVFAAINAVFTKLLAFTEEGAGFIFGNLVKNNVPVGTPVATPVEMAPVIPSLQTGWANTGAFFAFNVLPTIIFFASLMAVLYQLGVMQWVVRGFAWAMQRTMGTSGAESLSAAGNIFVGQTEAPLLVKPYVDRMTTSELMTVMTGGFATIAGGVLAAYVGMLQHVFPDIAGHLLAASVMSAPAALLLGKMMLPEESEPETAGSIPKNSEQPYVNMIDAAARGAGQGLKLALNVGAMLLAFIALIALLNHGIAWVGWKVGFEWGAWSLEVGLGYLLAPLAWLMGVPWEDCVAVGSLLGVKTVVNEFVAYLQLSSMLDAGTLKNGRSVVIVTYALCGFANFSSIAIQLGGIGGIAPGRMDDLARIGLRAMIAGTLAAFMTATVAGMLIGEDAETVALGHRSEQPALAVGPPVGTSEAPGAGSEAAMSHPLPPEGHGPVAHSVSLEAAQTSAPWQASHSPEASHKDLHDYPVTEAGLSSPVKLRGVILVIGDGMGLPQVTLARHYAGEPLALDAIEQVAVVENEALRIGAAGLEPEPVTDSAAAATAIASGMKTLKGRVGVGPRNERPESLFEEAVRRGWVVGLVTDTRLTHATPAAFYAHTERRDREAVIAEQLVESRLHVAFGGGWRYLKKPELQARLTERGVEVVRQPEELEALSARGPVMGIFANSHLPFWLDRDQAPPVPRLDEMVAKALAILQAEAGPDGGFLLLVEAGRIDHGGHFHDAAAVATEVLELDRVVRLLLAEVGGHSDLLLLVTADHATGNLGVSGKLDLERLRAVDRTAEQLADELRGVLREDLPEGERLQAVDEKLAGLPGGPFDAGPWRGELFQKQDTRWGGFATFLGHMVSRGCGVEFFDPVQHLDHLWASKGHDGSRVLLWSAGAGSEHFSGTLDNTDIWRRVRQLLGWDVRRPGRSVEGDF